MSGWIGVDLDGTLAEYHGWVSEDHIGPPVPAMLERVKLWLAEGRDVRIFTARVCGFHTPEGSPTFKSASKAAVAICKWSDEHFGQHLPVTCVKDYGMIELWDDRCVQVEPNTGRCIGPEPQGQVTP